jgi:ATP-dependent Clp protease ATP-binding subunit ClpA
VDQNFTFERFTTSARRALFYARADVSAHGGTAITDAHLLLGTLKAAPELGRIIRPTVNIQLLSECLIGAVAAPSLPLESVEVPFDPAVKAVLLDAARLADGLGQWDVTPAHLFQAILHQRQSTAAACLRTVGIDLPATTEAVDKLVRGGV